MFQKEKIIAARYDNNLNEMFVLSVALERIFIINTPINPESLLEYYEEIKKSIDNTETDDIINSTGKLLDK